MKEVIISLGLCFILFVLMMVEYLILKIYVDVDECLVGFFVLGLVKVLKCLVVLFCILGMVVVNYFLVVVEVNLL